MCKPTIWTSPLDGCQICNDNFDGVMYDAKVFGSWGNVCNSCFSADTQAKIGTGRGQRYELQPWGENKAWLKVAG